MSQIVDVLMPESQEGTQSVIANWLKRPGDEVHINEPLVEISTDKVTMEVAAPQTGILKEIIKNSDAEVKPGDLLARIQVVNVDSAKISAPKEIVTKSANSAPASEQSLSPAVKKLLKEHNLDPANIAGTGKDGRITHEDVMRAVEGKGSSSSTASSGLSGRKVPHTIMRRSVANHMVQSLLQTAPHVTTVFQADLTKVLAHQKTNQDLFAAKGVKLTLTSYFVQATCRALQAVPQVNARWHNDGAELFDCCNVGIATALKSEGLIVPVLHDAEKLPLYDTAQKLQDLIGRARENKLSTAEVQNGTFTITNHGVSGSLIATPIINQPQSAILGLGKLEKRAMVVENNGRDEIVIKPMIYVTLTIDHRLLDGFTANSFLTHFVATLENWK